MASFFVCKFEVVTVVDPLLLDKFKLTLNARVNGHKDDSVITFIISTALCRWTRGKSQAYEKAMRLGPYPQIWIFGFRSEAYWSVGELKCERLVFENLVLCDPSSPVSLIRLVTIYSDLDQPQNARKIAEDFMSYIPTFSVDRFVNKMLYKLQSDSESLRAALLKAGLPE
jgi:hypothetical protein